jgi:hypothetical protein
VRGCFPVFRSTTWAALHAHWSQVPDGARQRCRPCRHEQRQKGRPHADSAQGRRQRHTDRWHNCDPLGGPGWRRSKWPIFSFMLVHASPRRNLDGATPLLMASISGNAPMIAKLIEAGADPNAPLTASDDTALMLVSRTGNTDAIKVLLDHGANIDAKEREHLNPWGQAASSNGCVDVGNRKPGYHRRKVRSHSSLSTRVLICRSKCAPRCVHCIC